MVASLEERRLKPVYDALDAGQHKSALNEITRYLKKSPKSSLGNALKCLTLQRLGKAEEALECYQYLLSLQSVDPLSAIAAEAPPELPKATEDGAADDEDQPADEVPKPVVQVKQPAKKPNKKGKSKAKAKPASGVTKSAGTVNGVPGEKDEIYQENVLQVLQYVLRPLGRVEDLYKLYSRAWEIKPDNLDLGVNVFMTGGVRLKDWEVVKRTALRLLRASQDPKPAFWAAFALYQQAAGLDEKATEHKMALLSLGTSIIRKYPAQPFQTAERFLLYIKLLRAQGRLSDALRLLTPDLKDRNDDDFKLWLFGDDWEDLLVQSAASRGGQIDSKDGRDELRKEHVKNCKNNVRLWSGDLRIMWQRWEIVDELAKQVDAGAGVHWDWQKELERAEDLIRGAEDVPVTNYKAYLSYLTCLFVILKQQTAPPNRSDRDYLADARQTLLDLAEQFGSRERAPLLALLEINRRLQSPDEAPTQDQDARSDSKTETIPLLKRYWALFGDKGCVMEDLKGYWPTETDSSSDAFNDLRAFLTEQIQGDKSTLRGYASALNAHKMLRYSSKEGDVEAESALTTEYLALYHDGVELVKDVPKTDVHPADDFGILAAQAYVACWIREHSETQDTAAVHWLVLAAASLHLVINNSPANGPARILLLRLYRILGCPSLIPEQIARLQMRTFQQDTVLHVVTERSSSLQIAGGPRAQGVMRTLLSDSQAIYRSTEVELTEGLVSALTEESYSQIFGMLEMSEIFGNSHQRILGDLELMRDIAMIDVKAMHKAYSLSPQDSDMELAHLQGVKDLRDWDLLPDYGSYAQQTDLKARTCMGPLTEDTWLDKMRLMWILVNRTTKDPAINPEQDLSRLETANCSELFTETERDLLAFVQRLCKWIHECAVGSVSSSLQFLPAIDTCEPNEIPCHYLILALNRLLPSAQQEQPWQSIQRLTALLEAFAMLDLTTSCFREKGSNATEDVRGHIAATLNDARKALTSSAEVASRIAAEDPWGADVPLTKALEETRKGLKASRQLAFQELQKELNKRSRA